MPEKERIDWTKKNELRFFALILLHFQIGEFLTFTTPPWSWESENSNFFRPPRIMHHWKENYLKNMIVNKNMIREYDKNVKT